METHLESDDAAEALALVTSSRVALADRLVTPRWYHPALGFLVGAFLASQAIPSPVVRNLVVVPYAIGLGVLVDSYRRSTGLWVNGLRACHGRRWAVTLAVVLGALFAGGIGLRLGAGWGWAPVAAGALAFLAVLLLGRRFDRAVRDGLRQQP